MNTAAYVLILSILLLGGAIATAGDRIGTRVGKARLSLFNLRPRQTATLVTILTGVLISASTLTILFATSESLRKGLFEYDQTQKKLRNARSELQETRRQLEQTKYQKSKVEKELSHAKSQQTIAQQRLLETNQSLQTVLAELEKRLAQQARTETNLRETQQTLERIEADFQAKRAELEKLQAERQALIVMLADGKAQIQQREREIQQRDRQISEQDREISLQEKLLAERNQLLAQREQQLKQQEQLLAEREKQLAERDQILAEREKQLAERDKLLLKRDELLAEQETRLKELATQKAFIEQEVKFLERDLQIIKEGTIVLRRNQVLASGVVRILQPTAARQAVDRLLEEANRNALNLVRPGLHNNNQQIIEIPRAEVEQLINQINDGQDYVIRILSAANYLLGEEKIQVFIDAAQNRVVFLPGDVVATTSIDPAVMNGQQIRERIELLLVASSFRGRRVGIISDTIQIADGRIETLIRFIQILQQQPYPVDVQAIAADVTYTAGPLKMNLVVVKNGKILFQT